MEILEGKLALNLVANDDILNTIILINISILNRIKTVTLSLMSSDAIECNTRRFKKRKIPDINNCRQSALSTATAAGQYQV